MDFRSELLTDIDAEKAEVYDERGEEQREEDAEDGAVLMATWGK